MRIKNLFKVENIHRYNLYENIAKTTVFLSFLMRERERDFANVSDRPTSLTVYGY
jgi:L-rhamnose mutarotase